MGLAGRIGSAVISPFKAVGKAVYSKAKGVSKKAYRAAAVVKKQTVGLNKGGPAEQALAAKRQKKANMAEANAEVKKLGITEGATGRRLNRISKKLNPFRQRSAAEVKRKGEEVAKDEEFRKKVDAEQNPITKQKMLADYNLTKKFDRKKRIVDDDLAAANTRLDKEAEIKKRYITGNDDASVKARAKIDEDTANKKIELKKQADSKKAGYDAEASKAKMAVSKAATKAGLKKTGNASKKRGMLGAIGAAGLGALGLLGRAGIAAASFLADRALQASRQGAESGYGSGSGSGSDGTSGVSGASAAGQGYNQSTAEGRCAAAAAPCKAPFLKKLYTTLGVWGKMKTDANTKLTNVIKAMDTYATDSAACTAQEDACLAEAAKEKDDADALKQPEEVQKGEAPNYYQVIGISKFGATPRAIEKACKKQEELIYKEPKKDQQALKDILSEACDTLLDADTRKAYDESLKNPSP